MQHCLQSVEGQITPKVSYTVGKILKVFKILHSLKISKSLKYLKTPTENPKSLLNSQWFQIFTPQNDTMSQKLLDDSAKFQNF